MIRQRRRHEGNLVSPAWRPPFIQAPNRIRTDLNADHRERTPKVMEAMKNAGQGNSRAHWNDKSTNIPRDIAGLPLRGRNCLIGFHSERYQCPSGLFRVLPSSRRDYG